MSETTNVPDYAPADAARYVPGVLYHYDRRKP